MSEKEAHRTPTRLAIQACAEWLGVCIRLGWQKDDLDSLEALWWKYHDSSGTLIATGNQPRDSEASGGTRSAAP